MSEIVKANTETSSVLGCVHMVPHVGFFYAHEILETKYRTLAEHPHIYARSHTYAHVQGEWTSDIFDNIVRTADVKNLLHVYIQTVTRPYNVYVSWSGRTCQPLHLSASAHMTYAVQFRNQHTNMNFEIYTHEHMHATCQRPHVVTHTHVYKPGISVPACLLTSHVARDYDWSNDASFSMYPYPTRKYCSCTQRREVNHLLQ